MSNRGLRFVAGLSCREHLVRRARALLEQTRQVQVGLEELDLALGRRVGLFGARAVVAAVGALSGRVVVVVVDVCIAVCVEIFVRVLRVVVWAGATVGRGVDDAVEIVDARVARGRRRRLGHNVLENVLVDLEILACAYYVRVLAELVEAFGRHGLECASHYRILFEHRVEVVHAQGVQVAVGDRLHASHACRFRQQADFYQIK